MQRATFGLIYFKRQSGTKQISLHPMIPSTRSLLSEERKVDFFNPAAYDRDYKINKQKKKPKHHQ